MSDNSQSTDTRTDTESPDCNLQVVILDTSGELHEFRNSRGVWVESETKGWSTYVVDSNGEKQLIVQGEILYSVPEGQRNIPDIDELKDQHRSVLPNGKTLWGQE